MTFVLLAPFDQCGCPCHDGLRGHFHCWTVCCDRPDVVREDRARFKSLPGTEGAGEEEDEHDDD